MDEDNLFGLNIINRNVPNNKEDWMDLSWHIALTILLLSSFIPLLYNNPDSKLLGIDYWYDPPHIWDNRQDPNQNSKHFLDFYSFTHISHALLFGIFTSLLYQAYYGYGTQINIIYQYYLVMGIELFFEVIENTDIVINRFRIDKKNRLYTGDSLANISGDLILCALGFQLYSWLNSNLLAGFVLLVIEVSLYVLFGDSMLSSFLSAAFPR